MIICTLCSFCELNEIIYIIPLVSCWTHNFLVHYSCRNDDDADSLSHAYHLTGDGGEPSRGEKGCQIPSQKGFWASHESRPTKGLERQKLPVSECPSSCTDATVRRM